MALGIEQNSIAPQLIQSSGQALVQGIRQIGQQISGHLTEMQTKRDLAAMAQDLQGINPQSNEFPVQLTQLVSRHPMAVRDERGQMALSVLGKAHGAWQAEESDARAFNRAMALQGYRSRAAQAAATTAAKERAGRPINTPGGLYDPELPISDPLTGETLVGGIVPGTEPPNRGTGNRVLAPGAMLLDPTGKKIAENPRSSEMTPYQREQLNRMGKKDRISAINREIDQFDQDIKSAENAYENIFKRETEATDPANKARYQAEKTEMGKVADQLKAEKKKRMEMLRQIESAPEEKVDITTVVEPELGGVPQNAAAPSPANAQRVPVFDPNGNPMQLRADQLEAALQAGWKRR